MDNGIRSFHPIACTKRLVRILWILVRRSKSPRALAGGFACGLGMSMIPLPFLNLAVAFGIASRARLNLLACYIGTVPVNPITAPIVYAVCYATGFVLLDRDVQAARETLSLIPEMAQRTLRGDFAVQAMLGPLRNFVLHLFVGGGVLAVVVGGLSFLIVYSVARTHQSAMRSKTD